MPTSAKKSLGKGLAALLGNKADLSLPSKQDPQAGLQSNFLQVDLADISPNQNQPRKSFDKEALAELSKSILDKGIIQPLLLNRLADGKFQIIAGERRFKAAKLAGLTKVPAVIKNLAELPDKSELLALSLIENIQRQNLNPLEEAAAYQSLMLDFGYTQQQLADKLGKSRPYIANIIRLLNLPNWVQMLVIEGKLSAAHGRSIAGLSDVELQKNIVEQTLAQDLSVRQIEKIIATAKHKPPDLNLPIRPASPKKNIRRLPQDPTDPAWENIDEAMLTASESLKTKVSIKFSGTDSGQIEINFKGIAQFNFLYDILTAQLS